MPLLALVIVLLLPIAFVLLMPLTLVQRYRIGTARRPARGWVVTLNLAGVVLSALLFLLGAAVTSAWVPNAFTYSLLGMAAGAALGLLGLLFSRWEATPRALYFTPNRWLVLLVVLVVTVRLLYGLWRAWHTWQSPLDHGPWLETAGVDGSLAAGAVVLGYYMTYWAGVRSRLRNHQGRRGRMSYEP